MHLLRLRWRREHSFKYLSTHYGIDQIMQDGITTAVDTRLADINNLHPRTFGTGPALRFEVQDGYLQLN